MEAIISTGLTLLSTTAPFLSGAGPIGAAISFLATILPPAVKLVQAEIPVVKSIIATLRGNKSITVDQMAQLDALDARCDAALDAAIDKAEAEDAAANPPSAP